MSLLAPSFSDDEFEPMDTDGDVVINFLENVPPNFKPLDPDEAARMMTEGKREMEDRWKAALYDLPGISISPARAALVPRSAYDLLYESPKNETDRADLRSFYSSFIDVPTTSHGAALTKEQRQRQREKALRALTKSEKKSDDSDSEDGRRVRKRGGNFSPKSGHKRSRRDNAKKVLICLQGSLSGKELQFVTETVEMLGGTIVNDIEKATCFVGREVRISTKFLCAVARHIPIVSLQWIRESKEESRFVETAGHLLRNEKAEAQLKMNMEQLAGLKEPLLKGWYFVCVPEVTPSVAEVDQVVRCCGGTSCASLDQCSDVGHAVLITNKKRPSKRSEEMIALAKKRGIACMDGNRFYRIVCLQSEKAFLKSLER
ncbi:hypothetical protein QR680_005833 [Steinernema hermaphroditum]|uniref:PAX-interacting protein 1 n=1 Tax=Steinernema hermaphroditum TaxID=289476 RepID=A0AA39LWD5_9BILA|nr:hypothetical protein QR680_005833 [Steinernema hermaphroditum]